MFKTFNNDILGKTIEQKNGLKATCIEYRGCHNIDVQFEDGAIVINKTKQNFLNGSIKHTLLSKYQSKINNSSCLNQVIMQKCGMKATCVKYLKAIDIDVQFEDGTIVCHRSKVDFLKGGIKNPNLKRKNNKRKLQASCIGHTRLMNNGMEATCIEYRGYDDIDIQFEDGTIVKHRSKLDFLKGVIENPNWWQKSFPQRIVYECIKAYYPKAIFNYRPDFMKNKNTGLNYEIDIWIPELNVAIEYDGFPFHSKENINSKNKYNIFINEQNISKVYTFIEDGCVEHKSPKHINFKMNSNRITSNYSVLESAINDLLKDLNIGKKIVLDDNYINSIREKCSNQNLGLTIRQFCGMNATCIGYKSNHDIDVQFEDGTIVKKRCMSNFLKGFIKNPTFYDELYKDRTLNKTIQMKNGMKATCIAYRKNNDIDIQFEDGTIVYNVQTSHFTRGAVKHPSYNSESLKLSNIYLNETKTMNNGMKATIVAYRSNRDIDVQFEDGTFVYNKRKGNFDRGEIENPNYNRYTCLNQTIIQSCGLKAKCIAYRGCFDIDVEFEDGIIVKSKRKQAFMLGNIKHPNIDVRSKNSSCLNETRIMKNGLKATCIAYRSARDIDIQFENGIIVTNKRKVRFYNGQLTCPKTKHPEEK